MKNGLHVTWKFDVCNEKPELASLIKEDTVGFQYAVRKTWMLHLLRHVALLKKNRQPSTSPSESSPILQ